MNSFGAGPVAGLTACRVYAILGTISGAGGAVTNAFIAFDRYR